jgi:hypothetical protein
MSASEMADRPRVIVALPDLTECAMVAEWLTAEGFEPVRRPSPRAATEEVQARAFDLLVTDTTFAVREKLIATSRGRNPLTPAVVIGSAAMIDPRDAVGQHTMHLSRPIQRSALVCTVSLAIMDSRPPRRSPRKIASRFDALVNDVSSNIIDVSYEGLRLELPRQRVPVPPPHFCVRVPLIGLAVTVQRVWARSSPDQGRTPVTWCGGALSGNHPGVEQRWRAFVDMIPTVGRNSST